MKLMQQYCNHVMATEVHNRKNNIMNSGGAVTMPGSPWVGELIGELTVAHASALEGVTRHYMQLATATQGSGTATAGSAGTSTAIAP